MAGNWGMVFNRQTIINIGGFSADEYPSLDYWAYSRIILQSHLYTICLPLTHYDWDDSISNKYHVRKEFIIQDTNIQREIFQHYKIPSVIYNSLLLYRSTCDINRFRDDFGDKKVDLSVADMNLRSRCTIIDRLFGHFFKKFIIQSIKRRRKFNMNIAE